MGKPMDFTGPCVCRASIDFDTAQAILASHASPLGQEIVPLAAAAGRYLAAPMTARIDAPRRDCAAMDGYAVRGDDFAAGQREFVAVGTVCAGQVPSAPILPGQTMRVMTGAPIPQGADRVVMVEHCEVEGSLVRVCDALQHKPHIRRLGSDFESGDILLESGSKLTGAALVVAAAADRSPLTAWRRPRLALLATGDELAPPGTAADTAQMLPDSLSAAIAALILQWGGEIAAVHRIGDDPDAIRAACRSSDADVVVLLGGASRGDRDFGRSALQPLGLELAFADVAIRPGKPVWYGRTPSAHILGLPGNPTAAITIARLFLAPLIAGLAGGDASSALPWRLMPARRPIAANGPREAFLCASASYLGVDVHDRQEASGQLLLGRTDVLIRRPAFAPEALASTLVPALPL